MYLHFKAIADSVDLPIIIYNILPRSVVDMSVETMARLAKQKHRRREGRDREPRASAAQRALRHRFLPVVRGRSHRDRVQLGRRRRLHQRHRQRRAPVVLRHANRLGRGPPERRDGDPEPAGPLHDALFSERVPVR